MDYMVILWWVGAIVNLVGCIMIIVAAFREKLGWGLACIFGCGIGQLIYVITHWSDAKNGFWVCILGVALCLVSGGSSMTGPPKPKMPGFPQPAISSKTQDAGLPPDTPASQASRIKFPSSSSSSRSSPPAQPPKAGPAPASAARTTVSTTTTTESLSPEAEAMLSENQVGKTVVELKEILGKPKVSLKVENRLILRYGDVQFESDDGITISRQGPVY